MKSGALHARGPDFPGGESGLDRSDTETACTKLDADGLDRQSELAEADAAPACIEPDRGLDRVAEHELIRHGDTGIEVTRYGAGSFRARFTLQLASVSSAALAPDRAKWNESSAIDPGEAARQRALGSLACSLRPSQRVCFVHKSVEDGDGALRYRMLVEGEARGFSAVLVTGLARELLDSLRACLAVGADQFGFAGLDVPPASEHWLYDVELLPAAINIESAAGVAMGAAAGSARRRVLLPVVPKHSQTYLDGIVSTLTSLRARTQLVIEWRGLPAEASLHGSVEGEISSLLDLNARSVRFAGPAGPGAEVPVADVQMTHRALQGWVAEPLGALMRVRLSSAAPLAPPVGRMIGREVFLGRPFAVSGTAARAVQAESGGGRSVDLRGLVSAGIILPPLLPNPLSADAQGIARHYPVVDFDRARSGIVLGYSARLGHEIRFADRDRGQHCLVLGQTGSGKTRGAIEAMALQDMARGDGLVHIDLDGDSFDYLHAACPPARRSDIVSLDFTDFDASPGLNLLQFQTRWPSIERGFIVDNLVQIFRHEYRDTPEAFGPMFELYLTNATKLTMEEAGSTVADIVRVFADTAYRRRLLSICKDPLVAEFWSKIASRASGDASLENIAPYIVCKLTKLVDDELTRRVVGQAESTIDFRAGMDANKIFLIKLSKGLLSERGARFLGMLLTSRLFAAALSRADTAPHLRAPCHVYLDEFQNLVSPAIQGMLAESRKYGLRLTLANQNLSQLPPDLAQSVLTNCGTKIILRTGPQDAEVLAPWVKPHFSEADLVSLPSRHAVVRVVTNGVLSPPFAMRTRALADRDRSAATDAWVAAIRAESKRRYCVDAQTIDARMAARRSSAAEGIEAIVSAGTLARLRARTASEHANRDVPMNTSAAP